MLSHPADELRFLSYASEWPVDWGTGQAEAVRLIHAGYLTVVPGGKVVASAAGRALLAAVTGR